MQRVARIAGLIVVGLVSLAPSRPAHAWPPPGTWHVDRKAPCYQWPAVDWDGDGVYDRIDRCPNTRKGCTVDQYGCAIDGDGDGVCDGLDLCPDTPKGMKVDEHGCHEGAQAMKAPPAPPEERAAPKPPVQAVEPAKPVSEVERKLIEGGRIRLENVYFETNSARLLPESETTLDEVGGVLEKLPGLRVEVEGHTDTRGRAAYNMKLSQERAESVRQFLLEHFHLDAGNVLAVGYGETRPETKERNEEEFLRNRRVELRVLNPEALPKGIKVEKKSE
jgi:OOP family OmpA-OmpF porin